MKSVIEEIAEEVIGIEASDQRAVDAVMIALAATNNKGAWRKRNPASSGCC